MVVNQINTMIAKKFHMGIYARKFKTSKLFPQKFLFKANLSQSLKLYISSKISYFRVVICSHQLLSVESDNHVHMYRKFIVSALLTTVRMYLIKFSDIHFTMFYEVLHNTSTSFIHSML